MKRPMMTISGEPHVLLRPMSIPPINTRTVVFTTVPFLKEHMQKTLVVFGFLKEQSSIGFSLSFRDFTPSSEENRTVDIAGTLGRVEE